jgi:biopolymer transport protein TolQ
MQGGSVPDMSILGMFAQADIVVKIVMFILLLASFWCWAIVFDKFLMYRSVRSKMGVFEKAFWSGELLEELYERIKNMADHPMALIFVAAMHEWKMHASRRNDQTLKVGIKERIFQSMVLVKNQQMDKLEKNINFLATVGSTAPFVGLFGTVWGIMHSFTSIAAMQNVTLAVVAPGIAEALLATAIGLFAAIPAVIFYNKFTNDLGSMNNRLDDFAGEFGAILSRELDKY